MNGIVVRIEPCICLEVALDPTVWGELDSVKKHQKSKIDLTHSKGQIFPPLLLP